MDCGPVDWCSLGIHKYTADDNIGDFVRRVNCVAHAVSNLVSSMIRRRRATEFRRELALKYPTALAFDHYHLCVSEFHWQMATASVTLTPCPSAPRSRRGTWLFAGAPWLAS